MVLLNLTFVCIQTLSAYEQARQWNVKGNNAKLQSLGLNEQHPRNSTKMSRKTSKKASHEARQVPTGQSSSVRSSQNLSNKIYSSADSDSDSQSGFKSSSESSIDDFTSKWLRCPRHHKALEADQEARLSHVFSKIVSNENDLGGYPKEKYYIFAQRVCKAYAYLWRVDTNPKDDLHMNRENIAEAAVAAVYDQIPRAAYKPHFGKI